jgi:hypothetical protein
MKTTFLTLIVFSFFSLSVSSMNKLKSTEDTIQNEKKCSVKNLTLKTERIEKNRKFIFWKLPHKKITTVDRLVNTKGKVILKKTSIEICSSDACGDRKFRRIKIVNNEIWIFQYGRDPVKGIIKRYDFCKKYLGEKIWDEENFNDY